jgi:hypothetical protein
VPAAVIGAGSRRQKSKAGTFMTFPRRDIWEGFGRLLQRRALTCSGVVRLPEFPSSLCSIALNGYLPSPGLHTVGGTLPDSVQQSLLSCQMLPPGALPSRRSDNVFRTAWFLTNRLPVDST